VPQVERHQVEALREALKGSDVAAVKAGMEALTATLGRVATAAYQAASPMDGPGQPGSGDEGDGTGGAGGDGAEGEPAGAGARSGSAEGSSDDAVEGEFKEV
jgi:molecular chaperone DnaK